MSSIDALVTAWIARGWLALLAFTAAVLVVAALRKPCRRLFGTERAFQLWLLPPLAVLAASCRMRQGPSARRFRPWSTQSPRRAPRCRRQT
jgi:beta-lactamase regulating signal transducer with metallopeptidase domain